MNQIKKERILSSIILLILAMLIGAGFGWIAKTFTTDNKVKVASVKQLEAQKEFYETRTRILKAFYESGRGK